jgi:hypothetical protein
VSARLLPASAVLPSRPAAALARGGGGAGRGRFAATTAADDPGASLAAAVDARAMEVRPAAARGLGAALGAAVGAERGAPRPDAASYARSYGVAAYLAADALRARPRDEAVEVSVRRTADGGRLTVARRTAGDTTVAIEAQIA